VSEIQFDGFVYPAFDQLVSQVAKQHARSEGAITLSLVVRIPFGGGIGAVEHHSESPEAYFAHTAGLRVVSPSTPNDGFWMVRQAIECDDPVLFLEPKCRYWEKGEVDEDAPPSGLFEAAVRRAGTDATLVAYGPSVKTCLKAAEVAQGEGRSLEVIDLRSISPLDADTVARSVEKTGRLLIAHEAPVFGGMGAEIAARLTERCFYSLSAPPLRVGGYHTPYPPSRVEEDYLPNVDRLLDALDRAFEY
jgi:pyruvate dehydrogenase E1 component beta subunit